LQDGGGKSEQVFEHDFGSPEKNKPMAEKDMKRIWVTMNRAPVLTLWVAAVVVLGG
jgi:hypothetical protein